MAAADSLASAMVQITDRRVLYLCANLLEDLKEVKEQVDRRLLQWEDYARLSEFGPTAKKKIAETKVQYTLKLITQIVNEEVRNRLLNMVDIFKDRNMIMTTIRKTQDFTLQEVADWLNTDCSRMKNVQSIGLQNAIMASGYLRARYLGIMKTINKLRNINEEIGPFKEQSKQILKRKRSAKRAELGIDPMDFLRRPSTTVAPETETEPDTSVVGELMSMFGKVIGNFSDADVKTVNGRLEDLTQLLIKSEIEGKRLVRNTRKEELDIKKLKHHVELLTNESLKLESRLQELTKMNEKAMPTKITVDRCVQTMGDIWDKPLKTKRRLSLSCSSQNFEEQYFMTEENEDNSLEPFEDTGEVLYILGASGKAAMKENRKKISVIMPQTMAEISTSKKVIQHSDAKEQATGGSPGGKRIALDSPKVASPELDADREKTDEALLSSREHGPEERQKLKRFSSVKKPEVKRLDPTPKENELNDIVWCFALTLRDIASDIVDELLLPLRASAREDQQVTEELDEALYAVRRALEEEVRQSTTRKTDIGTDDAAAKVLTRLPGNHKCPFCLCHNHEAMVQILSNPAQPRDSKQMVAHCSCYIQAMGTVEPVHARTCDRICKLHDETRKIETLLENIGTVSAFLRAPDKNDQSSMDSSNVSVILLTEDSQYEEAVEKLRVKTTSIEALGQHVTMAMNTLLGFIRDCRQLLDQGRMTLSDNIKKTGDLRLLENLQGWVDDLSSVSELDMLLDRTHKLKVMGMLQGCVCPYCNCYGILLDQLSRPPLSKSLTEQNTMVHGVSAMAMTLEKVFSSMKALVDKGYIKDPKQQKAMGEVLNILFNSSNTVKNQLKEFENNQKEHKMMYVMDTDKFRTLAEADRGREVVATSKVSGPGQALPRLEAMQQLLIDRHLLRQAQAVFEGQTLEEEEATSVKKILRALGFEEEEKPSEPPRKRKSGIPGKKYLKASDEAETALSKRRIHPSYEEAAEAEKREKMSTSKQHTVKETEEPDTAKRRKTQTKRPSLYLKERPLATDSKEDAKAAVKTGGAKEAVSTKMSASAKRPPDEKKPEEAKVKERKKTLSRGPGLASEQAEDVVKKMKTKVTAEEKKARRTDQEGRQQKLSRVTQDTKQTTTLLSAKDVGLSVDSESPAMRYVSAPEVSPHIASSRDSDLAERMAAPTTLAKLTEQGYTPVEALGGPMPPMETYKLEAEELQRGVKEVSSEDGPKDEQKVQVDVAKETQKVQADVAEKAQRVEADVAKEAQKVPTDVAKEAQKVQADVAKEAQVKDSKKRVQKGQVKDSASAAQRKQSASLAKGEAEHRLRYTGAAQVSDSTKETEKAKKESVLIVREKGYKGVQSAVSISSKEESKLKYIVEMIEEETDISQPQLYEELQAQVLPDSAAKFSKEHDDDTISSAGSISARKFFAVSDSREGSRGYVRPAAMISAPSLSMGERSIDRNYRMDLASILQVKSYDTAPADTQIGTIKTDKTSSEAAVSDQCQFLDPRLRSLASNMKGPMIIKHYVPPKKESEVKGTKPTDAQEADRDSQSLSRGHAFVLEPDSCEEEASWEAHRRGFGYLPQVPPVAMQTNEGATRKLLRLARPSSRTTLLFPHRIQSDPARRVMFLLSGHHFKGLGKEARTHKADQDINLRVPTQELLGYRVPLKPEPIKLPTALNVITIEPPMKHKVRTVPRSNNITLANVTKLKKMRQPEDLSRQTLRGTSFHLPSSEMMHSISAYEAARDRRRVQDEKSMAKQQDKSWSDEISKGLTQILVHRRRICRDLRRFVPAEKLITLPWELSMQTARKETSQATDDDTGVPSQSRLSARRGSGFVFSTETMPAKCRLENLLPCQHQPKTIPSRVRIYITPSNLQCVKQGTTLSAERTMYYFNRRMKARQALAEHGLKKALRDDEAHFLKMQGLPFPTSGERPASRSSPRCAYSSADASPSKTPVPSPRLPAPPHAPLLSPSPFTIYENTLRGRPLTSRCPFYRRMMSNEQELPFWATPESLRVTPSTGLVRPLRVASKTGMDYFKKVDNPDKFLSSADPLKAFQLANDQVIEQTGAQSREQTQLKPVAHPETAPEMETGKSYSAKATDGRPRSSSTPRDHEEGRRVLKAPCFYVESPFAEPRFFPRDKRSIVTLDARAPPRDDYVVPVPFRKMFTSHSLRRYPLSIYPTEAEMTSWARVRFLHQEQQPREDQPSFSIQGEQTRRGKLTTNLSSALPSMAGVTGFRSDSRAGGTGAGAGSPGQGSSGTSPRSVVRRPEMMQHLRHGQQILMSRQQEEAMLQDHSGRFLMAEILDYQIPGMRSVQTYTGLLEIPQVSDSVHSNGDPA